MNRPELYHKTVDILVQAYFNDTLQHGNCAACAVGNIVAANMGYSFIEKYGGLNWKEADAFNQLQRSLNWYDPVIRRIVPNERQLAEIGSTGYRSVDLMWIESSFENCKCGNSQDEKMFNGLCAVIDTLDEIHENTSTEISQTAKSKFQKQTT